MFFLGRRGGGQVGRHRPSTWLWLWLVAIIVGTGSSIIDVVVVADVGCGEKLTSGFSVILGRVAVIQLGDRSF